MRDLRYPPTVTSPYATTGRYPNDTRTMRAVGNDATIWTRPKNANADRIHVTRTRGDTRNMLRLKRRSSRFPRRTSGVFRIRSRKTYSTNTWSDPQAHRVRWFIKDFVVSTPSCHTLDELRWWRSQFWSTRRVDRSRSSVRESGCQNTPSARSIATVLRADARTNWPFPPNAAECEIRIRMICVTRENPANSMSCIRVSHDTARFRMRTVACTPATEGDRNWADAFFSMLASGSPSPSKIPMIHFASSRNRLDSFRNRNARLRAVAFPRPPSVIGTWHMAIRPGNRSTYSETTVTVRSVPASSMPRVSPLTLASSRVNTPTEDPEMPYDPSETSSRETWLRMRDLGSKICSDLREKPGNPIVPSDDLLKIGSSEDRFAVKKLEREVGIIPHKKEGLFSGPDDIDADDLAERPAVRVTNGKSKSQSERYGVGEILRAVVDEQVEVDVVRRDVTAGCDGTGQRNTVDERTGTDERVCEFLPYCLRGAVHQSIRALPVP